MQPENGKQLAFRFPVLSKAHQNGDANSIRLGLDSSTDECRRRRRRLEVTEFSQRGGERSNRAEAEQEFSAAPLATQRVSAR